MHHIYHTKGLIFSSRNFGEAGKYYHLFTQDLGLLVASAQGIRKMSSKLRFVLQDFSYVKLDLVQGKDFWRITSASKTNTLENLKKNKEALKIFINITRLLKRLLSGEEVNKELFQDVLTGCFILEKTKTKEELKSVEAVLVLRILNNLGYIGQNEFTDKLIKSPFEEELVFEALKKRTKILAQINQALKETHL